MKGPAVQIDSTALGPSWFASGAKSLMLAASFGGNESMALYPGGSMATKALWMALIDSALRRTAQSASLRATRLIGQRLVQAARVGFQTGGRVASAIPLRCRGPFDPSQAG